MKNMILLLLLFSNNFIAVNAQSVSSAEVYSENGEEFYLILNGIRQNEEPQTNIYVEGLNSAYYHAIVIFEDQKIPQVEKKMFQVCDANGAWGKVTYVLKLSDKGQYEYKLKWRSFTPRAQVQAPPPHVRVVQYNTVAMAPIGVHVTETTTTTTSGPRYGGTNENVNINVGVGLPGFGMNVNVNEGSSNSTYTETTTTTTSYGTSTGGGTIIQPAGNPCSYNYSGDIGCDGCPMSQSNFTSARGSIADKSFSSSQMTMAKQIADRNCLTSAQVKSMMQLFDFENDKLEFAKYAYSRTYDINNYYMVNDAFEFESSITKLNQHIGY